MLPFGEWKMLNRRLHFLRHVFCDVNARVRDEDRGCFEQLFFQTRDFI